MKQQTVGAYRVGISFNPSQSSTVDQIKAMSAALINLIREIEIGPDLTQANEAERLKSLAATAIEEGAMWAVKAATKPAPMVEDDE